MRHLGVFVDLVGTTALALVACSSPSHTDSDSSDMDSTSTSTNSSCPPSFAATAESVFDQSSNRFVFESGDGYAMFNGAFYPAPQAAFHHESGRQGFCRLLTYTPVACTPECDFGQVCVSGECIVPLAAQGIGELELTGVVSTPIVLNPDGIAHYSWQLEPFSAPTDALVTLHGRTPEFSASACLVAPLVAQGDWDQLFLDRQQGEDITLTWSNPQPHTRIYLRMTTGIGTHGGISPVEVECEAPDRGSLTLPGDYLDQLFAGPFWSCGECGDHRLQRYHVGEAIIDSDSSLQVRTMTSASFFFRPGLK